MAPPPRVRPSLGRAFRHRNYRLFFGGQGLSLIGTWVTRFSITYLVKILTNNTALAGLVGFFSQAPTAVIAPFAGVLVDRWNRYRTLIVTQILAMLQSAALAFFAYTNLMTVWHLVALGAVQAVINAFDMPARQTFLGQMIEDRADLPNAIALNSAMVNSARLIGPALGALMFKGFGAGVCFTIDAVSYLAVISSLLAMRVTPRPTRPRGGNVMRDFKEGLSYVAHAPMIRSLLIMLAISGVLGGSYAVLIPFVATDSLHGGSLATGGLLSAAGVGALISALYLASRTSILGLTTVIKRCLFGLGIGLMAMRFVPNVWLAAPVMVVIGGSLMMQMAATNTIIQTLVPDDKLGRVMSLYAMAFFGSAPLGALLEGTLARRLDAPHTMFWAGVVAIGCAMLFARILPALRVASRPLYVELGVISPDPEQPG